MPTTTPRFPAAPEHDDDHDRGLALDRVRLLLPASVSRRRALGLFAAGAAGFGALAAFPRTALAATTPTPSETAGPYPADGSNGPDVLDDNGIVRRDIRSSFGTASATAAGVPLTIGLRILHAASSAPYPGAAVYLWHCDRLGRYSLYSSGVTGENWLRGIQVADDTGRVRFRSIFPGCYSGRWPHVHFEVYPSLAAARTASDRVLTSQLALPQSACEAVYATTGYDGSSRNLAATSLATDMVFRDGWSRQLATVRGSTTAGYGASLTVAV